MMKTYRTAEIASLVGIHANTVRFYEEQGLLPTIPRLDNGYRIYTFRHLQQLRLIRSALKAEVLSNHLRDEAIAILKTAASGMLDEAVRRTHLYRAHIGEEEARAREAIALTKQLLNSDTCIAQDETIFGRKEAAARLGVSIDVVRDWERNGLIAVPRRGTLRCYGSREMNILKIISILRHAHYSQMSIRRMLSKLRSGESDPLSSLDAPEDEDEIISVTDRYLSALAGALRDTDDMLRLLAEMQR